ncbi:hypothetical protein ILUMI_08660, partial [Ignelater luminosus]
MGKNNTESKDVQEASGNEIATAEQNLPNADAVKPEKKKKKKEPKPFDPLSDDPVVFKKIDFESALTAEEKAARKAAKLAAKKGKTPKKEKPPESSPTPAPEEKKEDKKTKPRVEEPPKDEKPHEEKKKKKEDKPAAERSAEKPPKQEKEKKEKKGAKETSETKTEKSTEQKIKKDKQEKTETNITTESEVKATKKEKKKKGKKDKTDGDKDKPIKDEIGKEKDIEEVEGKSDIGKKEKKEKGKGKGKGKKSLEPESSTLDVQTSISAFLEHYESQQLDEDEWTWESYTPSDESIKDTDKEKKGKETDKGKGKEKGKKKGKEKKKKGSEEVETIEAAKKEKKGKGKDKKGKKAAKEEIAPEPVVEVAQPAFDIMEEINRMKALAEAQALGITDEVTEEVSVAPSKKSKKSKKDTEKKTSISKSKKGPKKKLTPKELAQLAEEERIQAELEAKAAAEAERIRLLEERKAGKEKEYRETAEQKLRTEQLNNSLNLIKTMQAKNVKKALRDKEQREWEEYLKCDGLPDPYVCGELSTYLHLWDKVIKNMTIDEAAEKMVETLKLLDTLTSLIDDPVGAQPSQIENWLWIHHLFREYQQKMLDNTTYWLSRDIRKRLNRLNLSTAEFRRKEESFTLFLWLPIRLPPRRPNPRAPAPPPVQADIPEMEINILFPKSFTCQNKSIRIMYVKYDHLSDLCPTYHKPPSPEVYEYDINKATQEEWYSKLYYKYMKFKKPKEEDVSEQETIVDRAAGIIPTVPYQKLEPSASTYCIEEENKLYTEARESLFTRVEDFVVNLREYIILGGTYFINVFYQPPQPQEIVSFEITVSRLEIPKCLHIAPLYIKYAPPSPEGEETEEDIQRRQEELNKLMLVNVRLPEHIVWFDVPLVCQWDDNEQLWTTKDIYDLKYMEDENRFIFRTGRFGCFAMAMYKFCNMPYQSWELRPAADGTIIFRITAAIIFIEFTIKEDLICISHLENTPNNALQKIIGVYFTFPKLIR